MIKTSASTFMKHTIKVILMKIQKRCSLFFFNDTATTEIYTLSLHDALPICTPVQAAQPAQQVSEQVAKGVVQDRRQEQSTTDDQQVVTAGRSEEHTSELQSRQYLVCRLLLEKKNKYMSLYILHDKDFSFYFYETYD